MRFASAGRDNNICVWDASTRRCLFQMSNHTMVITSIKWGGEGLIYSASRDCRCVHACMCVCVCPRVRAHMQF